MSLPCRSTLLPWPHGAPVNLSVKVSDELPNYISGVESAYRVGSAAHGRCWVLHDPTGEAGGRLRSQLLRPPVHSPDSRRHDLRVTRRDDDRGLKPVQARPHSALGQPGVPHQGGHRRERACAIRPAWFARPTSTNLHALDGWPPRSAGTGARFSAHEIASTLTGAPARQCSAPHGAARRLVSVLVSFTPVRNRSPRAGRGASAHVADGGGHR